LIVFVVAVVAEQQQRVNKVCRCSDNRGLSVLLDSRLIIVLIVWAAALSTIILIILVVLAVDHPPPPPLIRAPSYPDLHHVRPDASLFHTQLDAGIVRRESSGCSSVSEAWIRSLRDENWILYPATATVISHRRTNSDSQQDDGTL